MKRASNYIKIASVMAISLLLFACATDPAVQKPIPAAQALASYGNPQTDYVIQPNDRLDIKFFFNPELNETITVRPDGMISLQLIDEIEAAGKTPEQLDQELSELYGRELRKPVITVIVRTYTGQRIFVGGEVNQAGLINLVQGMTTIQAVFEAGGFKETAMPAETLVIRKGPQNEPVPHRVNLAALGGENSGLDFLLQPDDVVYVPKSRIAAANKFVKQYVQDLFLFRGISLGFSYEIWDATDSNNND